MDEAHYSQPLVPAPPSTTYHVTQVLTIVRPLAPVVVEPQHPVPLNNI